MEASGIVVERMADFVRDFFVARLTPAQTAAWVHSPGVVGIEPNATITIDADQGPLTPRQNADPDNWGLDRIDQRTAVLDGHFTYQRSGVGVDIYVVDTGVRTTHQEFTGRIENGLGFVSTLITDVNGAPFAASDYNDQCGHGTHVAGIAAGRRYGVAKSAVIVPVRIFSGGSSAKCSSTTVAAFSEGVDYVIRTAASRAPRRAVMNLSLGVNHSATLDAKVQQAVNAGIFVVAAAGNDGDEANDGGYVSSSGPGPSPACTGDALGVTGMLTVAATGGTRPLGGGTYEFTNVDDEPSYSNYGPCVDIYAPGTAITSAWPVSGITTDTDGDGMTTNDPDQFAGHYSDSGTFANSGTSMATPFVAGVAADFLEEAHDLTPVQLANTIRARALSGVVGQYPRNPALTKSPNLLLNACPSVCVPSVPKNVAVTRTARTEMNVSWEAPDSDGGAAITSYTATAAATGLTSVSCSATAPATSCKLTGLTVGTSYSITVAATNSAGGGASSTAKTLSAGAISSAPGTPTGIAANGEVAISWTAPTDNGGLAISKYTVTSTPDGKTCTPAAAALTCTVRELTNGTKYTFTVAATNDAGDSVSAASATIVPIIPWAFIPVFDTVTPGNAKVDLTWTEAKVTGTAPAGYFTGYLVKDASGKVVCTTTSLGCTVSGLTNATKVSFTLVATTIADTSQVATSPDVLVGGLRQLANGMHKRQAAYLSKLAATNSKGKVTWRSLSGGCRIVGKVLYAPAKGSACKLKVSSAKSGAFPAESLTVVVQLL